MCLRKLTTVLWRAVTAAVSPVAGDTFQGPEHHDSDPSGYIWVIYLFPARSVLKMSQNSGMCTGSFCHHWPFPSPAAGRHLQAHSTHHTVPPSQVFSGRAVSTCARHCWATDHRPRLRGPRTAGGAQGQQSHGLGGLLLGSQGPWRPVRGICHSGLRVHKNQPCKRLFGERDSY